MSASFELDYHEVHSLPLINSTTCFTGARRQQKRTRNGVETQEGEGSSTRTTDAARPSASSTDEPTDATTLFATELHTVAVHLEKNGACRIESQPVLNLLPDSVNDGDRSYYVCIGFDVLDEWQVVALMRVRSASSSSEEAVGGGTSADSGTAAAWRGGSMSDMTALWSVATSAEDAASLAAAAAPPTSATATSDAGGGTTTHRRTGSNSALEMNASSSGLSLLPPDQLQQLVAQSTNPHVHLVITNRRDPNFLATACLDFRPLAPTLCRFVSTTTDGADSLDASPVGVWLGSADDCKLRLYEPRIRDDRTEVGQGLAESSLELVCLDQFSSQEAMDAFSFRSPVMALDWCCVPTSDNNNRQCLAVACQDGTIRVVTYSVNLATSPESSSPIELQDVRETTVIVDGPIVCVSLFGNETCLRCLVGSLCGYACEILMVDGTSQLSGARTDECHQDPSTSAGADAITDGWQGPFIIAQDLWNSQLKCEDSVLCVSTSILHLPDGRELQLVAIGTHAGRCRVYGSGGRQGDPGSSKGTAERPTGPAPSVSSYELLWECQLPYSIHGVLWLSYTTQSPARIEDGNSESQLLLLVTTRRSVHVFVLHYGVVYDANLALTRLNSLLKEASCDEDSKQADRGHEVADVTLESRLE